MGIQDTFIRHYTCDFPACKAEGTADPRDGSEQFVCVTVDAGEADNVHRAVLCRAEHAAALGGALEFFGFKKVRR